MSSAGIVVAFCFPFLAFANDCFISGAVLFVWGCAFWFGFLCVLVFSGVVIDGLDEVEAL